MITAANITGHVRLEDSAKGRMWYARWRTVDQRRDGSYGPTQKCKKLGPHYTGKGRPPAGYFTERTANDELVRILDADRQRVAGGKPSTVTFGQAADEWLRYSEHDQEVSAATLRDYRRTVRDLKLAFGADTSLQAITAQHVEAHKTTVKATGVSARTVNRHLVILGGIFRRASAKWGLSHNPADGRVVKRLREQYAGRRIRFYRPEEVHALVRATPDEKLRTLFLTAALTGLRMGELLALRWAAVDFTAERIHVERAFCQTGAGREGPEVRQGPQCADGRRGGAGARPVADRQRVRRGR